MRTAFEDDDLVYTRILVWTRLLSPESMHVFHSASAIPRIYFLFNFIKKTHLMRSYEIDLDSGRRTDLDKPGYL